MTEAVLGTQRYGRGTFFAPEAYPTRGLKVLATVDESLDTGDNAAFLRALGPAAEKLYEETPLALGRVRGVRSDVLARMNPPPIPTWATYLVGGLAVAAGGAAGAMGYLATQEESRFNQPETPGPYAGADFVAIQDKAQGFQQATNVLYHGWSHAYRHGDHGVFTDWDGFPEPE